MKLIDKILVGFLLLLSFFFLGVAGYIVPSLWSVVFTVVSGVIFHALLDEYRRKMGKLYWVCEKVWGILLVIVVLLFVYQVVEHLFR